MPYISERDKERFLEPLDYLIHTIEKSGISNGELNYLMTRLCLLYIKQHGTTYNTLSDVVKALECAKLEFYRRMLQPYEDRKAQQNGDVYPTESFLFDKRNEVR